MLSAGRQTGIVGFKSRRREISGIVPFGGPFQLFYLHQLNARCMYMFTRKLKNVKVRVIEFSDSKTSERLDDGKVRINELSGMSEEEAIKALKPEAYAKQPDGSGWVVVMKKKKKKKEKIED